MDQTFQRRINLGVMAAIALVPWPLVIVYSLKQDWIGLLAAGTAVVVNSAVFIAYARGWDQARYIVVPLLVLIVAGSLHTGGPAPGIHPLAFVPPAMALVLTGPVWVVGSGVVVYFILLTRQGFTGVYASPEMLLSFGSVVTIMILSRYALDRANKSTETYAQSALEQARRTSEALELVRQQADDLTRRNEEQQQLLGLVSTLETTAITVGDGIVIAPLLGRFDSARFQALTARLLREVSEQRVRLLIVDASGLPVVDTDTVSGIERLITSLRLLGCKITLTGRSPTVANTLAQLRVELEGITIARTPQQAMGEFVLRVQA